MQKRLSLLAQGLFPETLPPCFNSHDVSRSFRGIIGSLDEASFRKRSSNYIRYNGTKHDRTKRFFGTPNIVSYFYVSTFIHKHWLDFQGRFSQSPYSLSAPTIMPDGGERAIKVASLSELSHKCASNIGYAPVILKTDISQFYASVYTHSISWSRHGRNKAKADTNVRSTANYFNALDLYIRNCQSAQTRGLLIGPDAFRLVAEFISCGMDTELQRVSEGAIVGAVRHVDDYYVGVKSEAEALVVLSRLREVLASYELQINDSKTKVISSLEPINDLWAQLLRSDVSDLTHQNLSKDKIELIISKGFDSSRAVGSDSPIKIVLRGLDKAKIYSGAHWDVVEPYLQRCMHYHPHAIDYICLLVVKRSVMEIGLDYSGWRQVAENLIRQNIPHRNHHEIVWLLWMMFCCEIDVHAELVDDLIKIDNGHVTALLYEAFADGRVDKRPSARFGGRLPTADERWLPNLVARTSEMTRASFGGDFSAEFEHLARRKVKLINIQESIRPFAAARTPAISRSRYGYDDMDDGYLDLDDDIGF